MINANRMVTNENQNLERNTAFQFLLQFIYNFSIFVIKIKRK